MTPPTDIDALDDEPNEADEYAAELTTGARMIPRIDLVPGVEEPVINQIIPVFARSPNVYQRNGGLVQIVERAVPPDSSDSCSAAPVIAPLGPARIREIISANFRFSRPLPAKLGGGPGQIACPPWVWQELEARAQWQHVRPLEGIVSWPAMRSDGTFVTEPGYDHRSGLFNNGERVAVVECPSLESAQKAAAFVLDLVREFPFTDESHRAAWLAYPLTILSRFGLDTAPVWVFDAPTPGSGKTLLAELGARMITGQHLARMAPSDDNEENRKRITAIAMEAETVVLIDNIVGSFGGEAFDAAMTAPEWKERILGQSKTMRAPLRVVWAVSGNNVTIRGDMGRRVLVCRLAPKEEKPDERRFSRTQAELLETVTVNRREYLEALVTILRHGMAREDVPMKPWGSFDRWSNVVRKSIMCLGLPDPQLAREVFRESSDLMGELRVMLMRRLHEKVFEFHGPQTSRELIVHSEGDAELKELFRELVNGEKNLTPLKLAHALLKLKDRPTAGYILLAEKDSHTKHQRWLVTKEK